MAINKLNAQRTSSGLRESTRGTQGHPEYDAMDIVVVSGMDSAEIAKRGGLAPGVTEFPKPVPWPQLRGYVQAAMSRRALSASR